MAGAPRAFYAHKLWLTLANNQVRAKLTLQSNPWQDGTVLTSLGSKKVAQEQKIGKKTVLPSLVAPPAGAAAQLLPSLSVDACTRMSQQLAQQISNSGAKTVEVVLPCELKQEPLVQAVLSQLKQKRIGLVMSYQRGLTQHI